MSYEEIWKKATKEVARERDCLNDKLNQAYEDGYQMEGKYRDMKTQRDTLIDDIAVLGANNERYRNRAENAMELAEKANCEVLKLERANAELMIASDKYTALTNHIRNMKFASPYSYNYIHLVNFIKELERADDE